jgi:hypothetical protein
MRFAVLAFAIAALSGLASSEEFDPARFEKEIIVPACHDPMQLEVLADGRVFFIERTGELKLVDSPGLQHQGGGLPTSASPVAAVSGPPSAIPGATGRTPTSGASSSRASGGRCHSVVSS